MQSKVVDRIGLGPEERELKLGTSFTNPKECAFHTLRYDFKPASVDTNKMATIDVGTNSQITVSVPPNLIFKGNAKPYHRQCIAIVNPETGEVTLEKLTYNIQVKKTRSENQKMSAQKMSMIDQFIAGQKPKKPSSTTKGSKSHIASSNNNNSNNNNIGSSSNNNNSNNSNNSNNTTTTTTTTNNNNNNNNNNSNNNNNNNKTSGLKPGKKIKTKILQAKSSTNNVLPVHSNSARNSPNSQARNSPNSLARFPSSLSPSNTSPTKFTLDDQTALDDWFNSLDSNRLNSIKQDVKKIPMKEEVKPTIRNNYEVGELSDSSSSCGSSSSGDSSDSSSDSESQQKKKEKNIVMRQNVGLNNASPDPEVLLKEDLQLSESGSDSD